eukprot:TRINITY_DN2166_c0_g1_i2.p1 TRINITY_DN2166_c0_g1~~TRINITY_DN2166_c0_g1_i2.p1  ORF type:complete len:330 (-),score=93.39 TRINITY_DN2166_c0_g1_i2:438-1427(-)
MLVNTLLLLIGLIVVATAPSFWFAVIGILFVGASSSFGESVLLGFLRKYPPSITGAWSSGTGVAGVGGSGIYMVLHALDFKDEIIFLLLIPTAFVYYATFTLMLIKPDNVPKSPQTDRLIDEDEKSHNSNDRSSLLPKSESPKDRIIRCTKLVLSPSIQLALVYFFEYCISVGFAAKSAGEHSDKSHDFWIKNSYTILSFTYQAGVLVSRSSLSFCRVKEIKWLTLLQMANFFFWFFIAKFQIVGMFVQIPLMFFVGLMGGAMYVNVFALLVDDPNIPEADRELSINLVTLWITVGITMSSLTEIGMDETILKHVRIDRAPSKSLRGLR